MADVLARVRSEMQDRLKQVEAELESVARLTAEKARVEQALGALPPVGAEPEPVGAEPEPVGAEPEPPARKPRRSPKARAPKPRTPRGANRAAVYAALDVMPGASAGEIAAAARVGREQAYAVLRVGVERGELKTVELGGGQIGYQLDRPVETAFPAT